MIVGNSVQLTNHSNAYDGKNYGEQKITYLDGYVYLRSPLAQGPSVLGC